LNISLNIKINLRHGVCAPPQTLIWVG